MTPEQRKMVESKLYTRQPEGEPPVRSSELVRRLVAELDECREKNMWLVNENLKLKTALEDVLNDCHAKWLDTPAVKRAQDVCDAKSPNDGAMPRRQTEK